MRKRKYSNLENDKARDDCLTELIDNWWNDITGKKHKNCTDNDDPQPEIHNLVGTTQILTSIKHLDLMKISEMLPNCCYDKQKFAAITIRINDPYCTILLFSSGKMVLTGCRTFVECMLASHFVVQFLRNGHPGIWFQLENIKIQNIVGNVNLELKNNMRMNLNAMMQECNVYCTYQKNTFPGLIYRPNNSPVVLLIFESGKIVITGGKSYQDVKEGFKNLWPCVKKFITQV